MVDAAGCVMTISTYELALTGGEALFLMQIFSPGIVIPETHGCTVRLGYLLEAHV